jgi:hypothetical protein
MMLPAAQDVRLRVREVARDVGRGYHQSVAQIHSETRPRPDRRPVDVDGVDRSSESARPGSETGWAGAFGPAAAQTNSPNASAFAAPLARFRPPGYEEEKRILQSDDGCCEFDIPIVYCVKHELGAAKNGEAFDDSVAKNNDAIHDMFLSHTDDGEANKESC